MCLSGPLFTLFILWPDPREISKGFLWGGKGRQTNWNVRNWREEREEKDGEMFHELLNNFYYYDRNILS